VASWLLVLSKGACQDAWLDLTPAHADLEREFDRLRCPDKSVGKIAKNLPHEFTVKTGEVMRRVIVHYDSRRRFGLCRLTIHCLTEVG
jgi:hypothetical protein